jgi:hypothetical protein
VEALDKLLSMLSESDRAALSRRGPRMPEAVLVRADEGEVPEPDLVRLITRRQRRRRAAARVAAYRRLFPDAKDGTPTTKDTKALGHRLHSAFRALKHDRDQHRAHRIESRISSHLWSDRSVAKALGVGAVVKDYKACTALLRDFYFLTEDSSWSPLRFPSKVTTDPDAQDAVDVALFRTISFFTDRMSRVPGAPAEYRLRRDALYAHLHKLHDERGADPNVAFNDLAKELPELPPPPPPPVDELAVAMARRILRERGLDRKPKGSR